MITQRSRYATEIALRLALNRRQAARRLIRQGVIRDRLPRRFFEELFIHLSLILGFPTLVDGLEFLSELFKQPVRAVRRRRTGVNRAGLQMLRRVYGNQTERLLENLRQLHPELPRWIVRDVYGRVYTRTGLRMQERELVNVVVLGVQGLDRQLYSHIRGAIRAGVRQNDLSELLRRVERTAGHARGSLVSLVKRVGNSVR